ncbi:hypothetical protein EMCRGX_G015730 [Ephydatia muelleri]
MSEAQDSQNNPGGKVDAVSNRHARSKIQEVSEHANKALEFLSTYGLVAESLKVPPLLARPFSDDAASKNEDTVDLRVLYFLIGVEKHNDDSKRNYFSSNRWDALAEIMLAEHRLELLQQYAREKRHYTKHAAAYWHEGGMQKTRSQMRETNFAAIDV